RDRSLIELREGRYETYFDHAAGGLPAVATASALIVFTAITWRSSWKYRARAYRYHYWDNGMIVANALAESPALNLPAKLVMGFIDDDLCRLIGIDGQRELPLSLLAIGSQPQPTHDLAPHALPGVPDLSFETIPLSSCEIDYPLISYLHNESALKDADEVRDWRAQHADQSGFSAGSPRPPRLCGESPPEEAHGRDAGRAEFPQSAVPQPESEKQLPRLVPLRPHSIQTLPTDGIGDVILRRGSTRRFARKQISFEELSTIIDRSTRGIACDCTPRAGMLNEVYMIVTRVDGLAPGAYYYWRDAGA